MTVEANIINKHKPDKHDKPHWQLRQILSIYSHQTVYHQVFLSRCLVSAYFYTSLESKISIIYICTTEWMLYHVCLMPLYFTYIVEATFNTGGNWSTWRKPLTCHNVQQRFDLIWFIVLNATFSNISAISWRPVLVVEEVGVPGENHRPWASNW